MSGGQSVLLKGLTARLAIAAAASGVLWLLFLWAVL